MQNHNNLRLPDNIRILILDSDEYFAVSLKERFSGEFILSYVCNPQTALEIHRREPFNIMLINLALEIDRVPFITASKEISSDTLIIAIAPKQAELKDLQDMGIYDIVSLPIDIAYLADIVSKGAEFYAANSSSRKIIYSLNERNASLFKQNVFLSRRLEDSAKNLSRLYEDLRNTYMRTITALAQAIDARDHYTHKHSENVAKYTSIIAEQMGLPAKDVEIIRMGAELHDIGKIGISDSILTKPSELSSEEWSVIKQHPAIGAQILEPLTHLKGVAELISQHHEHMDGSGYPAGLKGEQILLGAKIIHLADAYEVMKSPRAYRKTPLSSQQIIQEINRFSGSQFDSVVVNVFMNSIDKLQ